jgi:hypothetical protein
MYRDAGREERAAGEEAEAAILAEFLPEQLGEGEVEALAREAIAETGASSPADLGPGDGSADPADEGSGRRSHGQRGGPPPPRRGLAACSSHGPSPSSSDARVAVASSAR